MMTTAKSFSISMSKDSDDADFVGSTVADAEADSWNKRLFNISAVIINKSAVGLVLISPVHNPTLIPGNFIVKSWYFWFERALIGLV